MSAAATTPSHDALRIPFPAENRVYGPDMRPSDPGFPYTDFTRRTFFMPEMEGSAAEDIFRTLHHEIVGRPPTNSRIQRLKYIRDGQARIAEVGDAHHRGEKYVMALFGPCQERDDYYIVTIRRGFLDPSGAMFVHAGEVHGADYFL